jgi:hypothetical protein
MRRRAQAPSLTFSPAVISHMIGTTHQPFPAAGLSVTIRLRISSFPDIVPHISLRSRSPLATVLHKGVSRIGQLSATNTMKCRFSTRFTPSESPSPHDIATSRCHVLVDTPSLRRLLVSSPSYLVSLFSIRCRRLYMSASLHGVSVLLPHSSTFSHRLSPLLSPFRREHLHRIAAS